ncbi:MAG: hypothetical protein GY850_23820 [bacterium]|nr:hypothetical protein [bacterium]
MCDCNDAVEAADNASDNDCDHTTETCPHDRTVNIRIVSDGGVPATQSPSVLARVGISQRRTDLDLPTGFADASTDPKNFKIDVFDDLAGGDTVTARLSVRKPDRTAFSPAREYDIECKRLGGTDWFRSRYLRLVVDAVDDATVAGQTILTDWDSSDPTVEILGQKLKASYSAGGHSAEAEAEVGINKRRIRTAVHIMRATIGDDSTGVVTAAQAKQRIDKWFRRVYAQVDMAPQLTQPVRYIDPMANLISISDNTGANAAGGGQIRFRIRVKDTPDETYDIGPYAPPAGQTPMATADALAALINDNAAIPVMARTVQNPPTLEGAITRGSADIILNGVLDRRVEIEAAASTDGAQTATVGRVTAANFRGWAIGGLLNWVVGSLEQRTILQDFASGSSAIDIFVIESFTSGDRGQAMFRGSFYAAGKQALDQIYNSAFSQGICMDGSDNNPFSAPHEMGHDLLDAVHATGDRNQLMASGTSGTNVLNGTKRIKDTAQTFDSPATSYVQQTQMSTNGALTGW